MEQSPQLCWGAGSKNMTARLYIAISGARRELKHLSSARKRNHRDSPSSGERNGKSLNHVHAQALNVGLWGTSSE